MACRPQAPCNDAGGYAVFGQDPNVSTYTQGYDEAIGYPGYPGAGSVASWLGLSGPIIYYDMENYDQTNSSCQSAVVSFLDGWVYGLENSSYGAYVPGLYTNSGPAEADWSGLSSAVQDVLVAKGDGRATIWGLDCNVNGCGASVGVANGTWGEGYRAHQYLDEPTTVSESYGGTASYSIDRDIEWAQVDGGNSAKTYTFSTSGSPQLNCSAYELNDSGQGGGSGPTEGVGTCAAWVAFYFNLSNSPATQTSFVYPGSTGGTGAAAINNEDDSFSGPEIVGYYYPTTTGNSANGFIADARSLSEI